MLESLIDELLAPRGGQCPVGKWITSLDEADQQRMADLLAHDGVSAAHLVRVLRPYQKFSESSMRRHRAWVTGRGDILNLCSCA